MIFSSYNYIIFISSFIIFYNFADNKFKNYIIFIFNIIFYSFFNIYLSFALFLDLLINYYLLKKFISAKNKYKKKILVLSILFNVIILFFFKYVNFFIDNINFIFSSQLSYLNIILPVGISFFTFQLISYYVDMKNEKTIHNFIHFCNYIIFFPQLIAGPILRANQIINEFYKLKVISYSNFIEGFKYFSFGLFIKSFLSDNISNYSDLLFSNYITNLSALDTLVSSYLFGFQIYFDFSGYCLMAIGSALIIGIRLPNNFYFPYLTTNIRDFWQCWNITLGKWVRDYIYIPLLKTFKVNIQDSVSFYAIASLSISWLIMGLWHGASWNFVIWGIYHLIYIIFYRLLLFRIKNQIFFWPIHINLIMISWLIFRITNFDILLDTFDNFFTFENYLDMGLKKNIYLLCSIFLFSNIIIYKFRIILFDKVIKNNSFVTILPFCILNYFSFIYLNENIVPFIYFQF